MLPPKDLCAIPATPGVLSRFALRERQRPSSCRRGVSLSTLSTEHFNDSIATGANHPAAVLTPDDATDALPAHDAVACDLLRARAFLERPEPEAGIMTGGDKFASIRGEREG